MDFLKKIHKVEGQAQNFWARRNPETFSFGMIMNENKIFMN